MKLNNKTIQESTPGIVVTGGEITQSDYDNNLDYFDLMRVYSEMRNTDPIASTSLDILTIPIVNSEKVVNAWGVDNKTPSSLAIEAADYINWCFDQLNYNEMKQHLLLSLSYGFIMFEKVEEKGVSYNGKLTNIIKRISPIQHDTIQKFYYTDLMEFNGIQHRRRQAEKGEKLIDIFKDKLFYYSHNSEFGNVMGRSLYRSARNTYQIKQSIWKSTARAAARGAGIPVMTITSQKNESKDRQLKSTAETIGRTVGNTENAYVIEQEGVFKFRLEALQNQENNLGLIELCNREIVYNTLTQFITSGIGENGSRAATEAHKSPYNEALNAIIKCFEWKMNELISDMIKISYLYGRLPIEEYPYFVFERPIETDLQKVAANIAALVNSGMIEKSVDDEVYIREIFGLPDKTDAEIAQDDKTVTPENEEEKTPVIKEKKLIEENKLSDTVFGGVFEMTSGKIAMDKANLDAKEVVEKYFNMIVKDIGKQMKKTKDTIYTMPFKDKLYNELSKIYAKAEIEGKDDVNREVKKVFGENFNLADYVKASTTKNKVSFMIDTLYTSLDTAIKERLLNVNDTIIDNAGGIDLFIESEFKDSFKGQRANIVGTVENGYTDGRLEAIKAFVKDYNIEDKRKYTASLENREAICERCFPFDGLVLTKEEAENMGLNWEKSPINPQCLGGEKCRCQWFLVKEGFDTVFN